MTFKLQLNGATRLQYVAIMFAATTLNASAADAIRTVAFSGNLAAGTESGVAYDELFVPALNNSGQTAFRGTLIGASVDADILWGVWTESSGSLSLLARQGTAHADFGVDSRLSSFDNPVISDSGATAFLGFVNVPYDTFATHFIQRAGPLEVIAHEGGQVPGEITGVDFSQLIFYPVRINAGGETAFYARIEGPGINGGNFVGNWTDAGGTLHAVASEGSPATGAPDAIIYSLGSPQLNSAGSIAYFAQIAGLGVVSNTDNGVWIARTSGTDLMYRAGLAAPGTAPGVTFRGMSQVGFNDAEQVAFMGWLTGPGVNNGNDRGIWSNRTGSLTLVAREGVHAPGTPSGVVFGDLSAGGASLPLLNHDGDLVVRALLAGAGVNSSNNWGIYSQDAGVLSLLARMGDPAAELPAGVNFGLLDLPCLNGRGQVAFAADLVGTGIGPANDRAIWAQDGDGILRLLAREGGQLDVDDSSLVDLRTVSALSFLSDTGNEDGRPRGFNDLGQLAFLAHFTDGSSGVFVSNLVAVPETTTLSLFVLATLIGLAQYRFAPGARSKR